MKLGEKSHTCSLVLIFPHKIFHVPPSFVCWLDRDDKIQASQHRHWWDGSFLLPTSVAHLPLPPPGGITTMTSNPIQNLPYLLWAPPSSTPASMRLRVTCLLSCLDAHYREKTFHLPLRHRASSTMPQSLETCRSHRKGDGCLLTAMKSSSATGVLNRKHAWLPEIFPRLFIDSVIFLPLCLPLFSSLPWTFVFTIHSPEAFVCWENSRGQQRSLWPVLTLRIQMRLLAVGPAKKDQVLLLINPWKESNASSFQGKQLPSRLHQENKAGGLVTDSRSWHFPGD